MSTLRHMISTQLTDLRPGLIHRFIIRFINRWKRDDVTSAFKEQKASLWGSEDNVRVYCSEQLTPNVQALSAARKHKELLIAISELAVMFTLSYFGQTI